MSRASDFRRRQHERSASVLAKVAETRDARLSYNDLRRATDEAIERGDCMIELTVSRFNPPQPRKPIRLMLEHDGRKRRGPFSSEDHDVVYAGGSNWRTKWRTAEVDRWLEGLRCEG